ncbi:MAG TPA: GNAT family N-acetyltransferase [Vicinamibacterales bacterium]
MQTLPSFDLDAYRELLAALAGRGYALRAVTDAPHGAYTAHLRHDIDFFSGPAVAFGRIEAERGARASYYVLLTGPYNVFAPSVRRDLRDLAEMGHEIGLHYDLTTFPTEEAAAHAELSRQVDILSALVRVPVRTITTHQPHLGGHDPFKTLPDLRHAHDPRDSNAPLYFSDSCRGWRDEALLRCFGEDPPHRVMLLTHPELWLDGSVRDRLAYLDRVLTPAALSAPETYYRAEVASIWRNHAGGAAHDAREGRQGPVFRWADRAWVERSLPALEERFAELPEVPWTREQILREVPRKWELSLVALRSGMVEPPTTFSKYDILGFSFNSLRNGRLYIHAFFVAPEERRRGLGAALLGRLRARAVELGIAELGLCVDFENQAGLRWWLGRGFRVLGAAPDRPTLELTASAGG